MSKRDKIIEAMAEAEFYLWSGGGKYANTGDQDRVLWRKGVDASLTAALPLIEEYVLEKIVGEHYVTCAEAVCAERVQRAFKKLRKVSK